ncbi:uncharacterized protein UHOR_03758 [Ustilago hordei]|uniref:Uncharacterized protein n=1 Tax=Ustilago hordei TaxID=120017 RepID=I2FXW1_USTHO|nr:uncharacterized protein UHOR_03758 [Ustilago hordei]
MIALRTTSRIATRAMRTTTPTRFASTQATIKEEAASARGAAKETLGEAKGAVKSVQGSIKSTAQSAKSSLPSPPSPPSGPIVVGKPTIRRPVGSVRGGVLGFLFGFGIASAYGYYYLLKEYNAASNLMLASVEELQTSTEKITGHLQRLNKLEADLKSLSNQAASKAEYEKNRVEMKKIVDGIHDEVLDVKKQIEKRSQLSKLETDPDLHLVIFAAKGRPSETNEIHAVTASHPVPNQP